jgi:UDP-glucose 4-epimerase
MSEILKSAAACIGITGSSGMIGARVLAEVRAQVPAAHIRCLVRQPRAHPYGDSVQHFCGDLLSDADCAEFVDGLDAVVHLAQSNSPAASDRHWPSDCSANLLTTLNLLDAIRSTGNPTRFVFASSGGAIYGDHPGTGEYHEDLPCNPLSPYGIQKFTIEHYLRLGVAQGWLAASALRISNAYGAALPPERRQGLIGVAVARHRESKPIDIFGSIDTVRDYIHIDDVATAFLAALEIPSGFCALNVASAEGHSVADILQMLEDVSGRKVETCQSDFGSRQFSLTPRIVLSNRLAAERLGWSPRVPLREGIERLWNA